MTDIKPGDRITVTFEATVTTLVPEPGYDFDIMPDGIDENWDVKAEWCTKIPAPLPTKRGAVITTDRNTWVQVGHGWWVTGDRDEEPSDYFTGKDFEVISEGVDIP